MRLGVVLTAFVVALAGASTAPAQTPPPAPAQVAPASGASLVEPITLGWGAVVDPDGPIESYLWQVSNSSSFTTIIAEGFTQQSLPGIPVPTEDRFSGLPTGTYFWRVKATQAVGGAVGFIESGWSTVRSFSIIGVGPAPDPPTFTLPANGARFHASELFDIRWTSVPDAQYYVLEADDEPSFSYPQTLTTDPIQFGTSFRAGWGNEIPNIYYRIRSVSGEGVRGLPSAALNVKITNTAPVAPAPTLLGPINGASVSIPFTFDWTDTPNAQTNGYDLDIDDEPTFAGTFGVFLVQNVTRSDYMIVDILPPGTYFWRIRAVHGQVRGPWSAGGQVTIVAPPSTPPGLQLSSIIVMPPSASGGNPLQARVTLNTPAPAGGALVKVASDYPGIEVPSSVLIPPGATDAMIPISTVPVAGMVVSTVRAGFAGGWQMSSIGLEPILYGLSIGGETIVGGDTVTGTVALLNPAPPGGVAVTIASSRPDIVTPPTSVVIPAGATGATFSVATALVSSAQRLSIDLGTPFENYRAPRAWVTIVPPGTTPAASLESLTLAADHVTGGSSTSGTVRLTAPAPANGAVIRLSGAADGHGMVQASITIPAGGISGTFTITSPPVSVTHYALIQATYPMTAGPQAKLLAVNPGTGGGGTPTLLGFAVSPLGGTGAVSMTGTVQLVAPAPADGAAVTITSQNPSVVHVPATVMVAAGNTAASFTLTASPVSAFTSVQVDASAGGVTKSEFLSFGPDPNNPPVSLQSLTLGASTVTGGSSVSGTVTLTAAAPAGGTSVTLAINSGAPAQIPPIVTVAAGQTQAGFTVTTSAVTANATVTITGFLGSVTRSASLTVTPAGAPAPGTPSLVNPANGATVALPVTLDWSDVTNAASYEIQVDDSSGFTAPLVQSLTSTASQTSVTGLAAVQHWWRVRATNSAGTAGNWSASRSFTPSVGGGAPPSLTLALDGVPASIRRSQTFTATGTVTNTGGSAASGYSMVVSFSPSNSLRLQSPQSATQSVATVAAGTPRTVSWQLRADRAGTATVTMTLRNASGATVATASRPLSITN